jgi:hypothetical protein
MFRSRRFRWWNRLSQPVTPYPRPIARPQPGRVNLFLEGLEGRALPSVQFTPAAYTVPAHPSDQALGNFSGGFAPVEPTLSVNALDPGQINVSSQAGLRASTSAGGTFTSPAFFSGSGGGDTSTAYDGAGRLFWVNLGGPGILISQVNPTTGAVIPGTTFTVDSGSDDKEFLAADPRTNNLYVAWTRFSDTGGTFVDIRRSTNQGQTWSPLVEVDNGFDGFTWPATVTVAPDGHVFVAYHSVLNFVNNNPDNSGKVVVVRYNNDLTSPLRSLAEIPAFADITFNVQTAGSARIIPHMKFWTQGAAQPQILADPVRPGNIYVISADSNNVPNDPMDVRIARSTDDGQTWTTSLVDTGPNASAQLFPQAAIDQFGDIVVAYYDNRRGLFNPNGNYRLDVFAKYSIDGGQTWSPAFQVNDPTNPFDPDPGAINRFSGPPPTTRIGEYFGLGLFGGTAYVAWNGNTYSDIGPVGQQVWFNTFAIRGALTVTGTAANDTITIRNLAGNAADVEVLVNGQQQYVGLWSALTGISVAPTLGNDTINIEDTHAGTPVTVGLGLGFNNVNISPTAQNLNTIQGAITVEGGASGNLNVDDQADQTNGDIYTLTATSVTRTGAALISYGSLGRNVSVGVNGGSANHTYNITGARDGFTTLHTGLSASTVNVRAASGSLTINGDGGAQTVNIGSQAPNLNGTLASITAPVTVFNSSGALNVDDSGDNTGSTGTVSGTQITGMGLGAGGAINYSSGSSLLLSSLTVHGGSGSNTYNVAATPTSAGGTTTLDTGFGNDTVNVQAATEPLTVDLGGPGTINVGSTSRTLDSIQGTLTLNHVFGPGTLNVNDDGSTAAQTYTLNGSSVTRTGAGLISYGSAVVSIVVNGGQGSNVYDVQGTENLSSTTLNTGNGRDTVNVQAINSPLTVNPGSGTDMVNIGDTSNTLNEILDVVTVNGRSSDTVNMFDQGSTTPHTYTLTAGSMTRGPRGPTINFPNCRAVLHRGVTGGGSPTGPLGNVIDVLATDPNAPVAVVADNGDIVNVGNDTDGLDEIQGALSIDGGDGTVPLNINDQMTAGGQLYDLLPGELDRSGAAPITFQDLQQAVLNGGGGGNTFDVNGVAEGAPVTINTGTGFGNLVRMRRHDLIQDALTLNGQGPSDRVGYVAYTTDVYVNLLTGVATDLAAFTGVHNVTGGQANNVIVADGSETSINGNLMSGSSGRNLIISGGGTGTLYGSGNGDILIGGTTAYDLDRHGELQAILAEWTRSDLSYTDRVAHILHGDDPLDPYALNASNVFDNGAANTITGNSNGNVVNLYYVTHHDTITDLTAGEVVVFARFGISRLPVNPADASSNQSETANPAPAASLADHGAGQSPASAVAASSAERMIVALAHRTDPQTSDLGQLLALDLTGLGDGNR